MVSKFLRLDFSLLRSNRRQIYARRSATRFGDARVPSGKEHLLVDLDGQEETVGV